jgi:hypothetical protein
MRGVTLSNSELCKMQSIGASPATMSLANTRTGDYERTRTLPERLNLSKQKRERKVAPSFLFSGVSSPPGTWRSSRTDFVSHQPQFRRDAVDISDLTRVARITCRKAALRAEDGGEGSIEVAVEEGRFGLNEGRKVVEEVLRHAIDRQAPKQCGAIELRKESIFDPLLVGVGRDYFAENLVRGALRLLVVCVRHRVYKPSLSLLAVVVGLATRHASRGASGVPRPVKVERRKAETIKKPAGDGGLLEIGDLEWAGCLLPWEEGEERKHSSS